MFSKRERGKERERLTLVTYTVRLAYPPTTPEAKININYALVFWHASGVFAKALPRQLELTPDLCARL